MMSLNLNAMVNDNDQAAEIMVSMAALAQEMGKSGIQVSVSFQPLEDVAAPSLEE